MATRIGNMVLHEGAIVVVEYDAHLDIRNIEQLPRGYGCKYLEVLPEIESRGGMAHQVYIARCWRRKPKHQTTVVKFQGELTDEPSFRRSEKGQGDRGGREAVGKP